jgi:hypothetical protein
MKGRLRFVLVGALVVLGAVYVACVGFGVQTMGDYEPEFATAMNALLAGHLHVFMTNLGTTDGAGGSLVLRAPAALLAKVIGGGQLTIFRAGALECVLALGGLGLWLARGMRGRGCPALARGAVIAVCVLTPLILGAVLFGHPEEALGAALCVAAVLLAGDGRTRLAAMALGLAVANKPWGLIAVMPALLAAPRNDRLRLLLGAGAIAGAWFAAETIVAAGAASKPFADASPVAHPEDLWWPVAYPTVAPGDWHLYFAPSLVLHYGRELALVLMLGISLAAARVCDRSTDACLALLAGLMLLRCLLDPGDHLYYHVPFIAAVVAWEARSRGWPLLGLLGTGLLWLVFHTVSGVASLEIQFLAYMAIALPMVAILLAAVLARPIWLGRAAIVRGS